MIYTLESVKWIGEAWSQKTSQTYPLDISRYEDSDLFEKKDFSTVKFLFWSGRIQRTSLERESIGLLTVPL